MIKFTREQQRFIVEYQKQVLEYLKNENEVFENANFGGVGYIMSLICKCNFDEDIKAEAMKIYDEACDVYIGKDNTMED